MSLSTEALWFLLWFLTFKFLVAEDHDVKVRLPMTYAIYGDQGDYNAQTWPSQMTPSGTLWQSNIAIENHKLMFFWENDRQMEDVRRIWVPEGAGFLRRGPLQANGL